MRIASLGYNPINQISQNRKSKQQNAPAFRSLIRVLSDTADAEQIATFIRLMGGTKSAFEKMEAPSLAISEDYQELIFDPSFDKKARILVNILNEIYAKGQDFCFQFLNKSDKLN